MVTTFLLHEFSHWLTGEILGYRMQMTLNKAYPLSGAYRVGWHYTLVSAVGPVVTLLQSIVLFIWIRKKHTTALFPFLSAAFYLELLSGIMNFRNANDLGRISETFGWGLFTIPVIFVAIHLLLLSNTLLREKYSPGFVTRTFIFILVFSSVWILLNNKYSIIIL